LSRAKSGAIALIGFDKCVLFFFTASLAKVPESLLNQEFLLLFGDGLFIIKASI